MAQDWPPLYSSPGQYQLNKGPQFSISKADSGGYGQVKQISFVDSALNSAINGTDVTVTLPNMLQGDVVYVFCGLSTAAGGGTSSSGWTQVGSTVDNTVRTQVFRKVMGRVPDATFVLTGSTVATDSAAAVAYALRGVNTNTPEDATATTATGTSTDPDSPSITTVSAKSWVLAFAASAIVDATITVPTSYVNLITTSGDDTADVTVAGAMREVAIAGAENPAAFTGWSSAAWVAWSVAVIAF